MTFQEQIEKHLSPLPSKWREKLTILLCDLRDGLQKVDCEQVKECETLTSLSDFTVDGTQVSITYKDEKGVSIERTFNLSQVMNNTLEGLDPNCLTSQAEWDTLTYSEKIQLLINARCNCCE